MTAPSTSSASKASTRASRAAKTALAFSRTVRSKSVKSTTVSSKRKVAHDRTMLGFQQDFTEGIARGWHPQLLHFGSEYGSAVAAHIRGCLPQGSNSETAYHELLRDIRDLKDRDPSISHPTHKECFERIASRLVPAYGEDVNSALSNVGPDSELHGTTYLLPHHKAARHELDMIRQGDVSVGLFTRDVSAGQTPTDTVVVAYRRPGQDMEEWGSNISQYLENHPHFVEGYPAVCTGVKENAQLFDSIRHLECCCRPSFSDKNDDRHGELCSLHPLLDRVAHGSAGLSISIG
ncbi:hypothetical protein P7C73_g5805, partial [Tremellales sp. Uapishka_1]